MTGRAADAGVMHSTAGRPAASKWHVLAVVGLGTFMVTLGSSMTSVALPLIRRDVGADIRDAVWVVTAYLLTITATLLTVGRIGDLIGYKRVFVAGFAVFGASSLAAALTESLGTLVVVRVVQGLGASMLSAIGPALLTSSFAASERGRALGLQATLTYAGLTTGPTLGGWLAARFGWQSVFTVNVPIALLGMLAASWVLRPVPRKPARSFDTLGAVLVAASLAMIFSALSRGERWGWSSARTLGTVAVGAILMAVFVRHEARTKEPLLPLWLLRAPSFAGAHIASFLQYVVIAALSVLVPFYLQTALGLAPTRAGWLMTAQPAVMAAVAAGSGYVADRVGPRVPAVLGMVLLALGVWRLGYGNPLGTASAVVPTLAIVGLGAGLFTPANNSILMGSAPRDHQAAAAALLAIARNMGMVSGAALAAAAFSLFRDGAQDAASAYRATFDAGALVAIVGAVVCLVRPANARRSA